MLLILYFGRQNPENRRGIKKREKNCSKYLLSLAAGALTVNFLHPVYRGNRLEPAQKKYFRIWWKCWNRYIEL